MQGLKFYYMFTVIMITHSLWGSETASPMDPFAHLSPPSPPPLRVHRPRAQTPHYHAITNDQYYYIVHAQDPKELEKLKTLLDEGTKENRHFIESINKNTNSCEETLLMVAAKFNLPALKAILKYNPNLTKIDKKSDNALKYAIKYGPSENVKELLEAEGRTLFSIEKENLISLIDSRAKEEVDAERKKEYEKKKDIITDFKPSWGKVKPHL